jgi:hypothetical protein
MKITEFAADQVVLRFDVGFDYDIAAVEALIQRQQHRLTTDGYAIISTGRRDTLEGMSVIVEAVRFRGKEELDGE